MTKRHVSFILGNEEILLTEKPKKKLSDASFEIMELIWQRKEASVQDIHAAVNARRDKPVKKETVQVQVSRLERYGWLHRRREGKVYLYSARHDRDATTRAILRDVRDRVFGGSQSELIRCLLNETAVSDEEMHRIRDFLSGMENDPHDD